MSTLGKMLDRGVEHGIAPEAVYNALEEGYKKGVVSYFRSNGKNHAEIEITPKHNIPILFKVARPIKVKKHFYQTLERLELTTPSSCLSDVREAKALKYDGGGDIFVMKKVVMEHKRTPIHTIQGKGRSSIQFSTARSR